MTPAAGASKREWRSWARSLDPVSPDVSAAVAEHVRAFLAGFGGAVLGYVALPDELTCPPGVTVLPRVGDDGTMTLHHADGPLERHRFGVDQPGVDATSIGPQDLTAVLVPGRVFDRRGYRLGRGGGHYDRLLPELAPAIPVIGVACTARLVDALPRELHDRPMTHLATENGVNSTS